MSYFTPLRVEADQKEIIINQLKGEVYNLRKNQQDYLFLEDQFRKLEHKYKLLQEDKILADNQFRSRHDMALRNIAQLKNQADALRAELRDRNLELSDLDTDGNTLKTQLDQRNIQIQKLKTDINSLLADSEQLLAERARLEQQFALLKSDKVKLLDELRNLEGDNDSVKRRISDSEKYLAQIDMDGKILRDKILAFENQNNNLDEQIIRLTDALADLQRHINQELKALKNLQNDIATLHSINDKNKSEAAHFQKATQMQLLKNSDLAKALSQSQNTLRAKDSQILEATKGIRNLDHQNQNLTDLNARLSMDLEELHKHLDNLSLLNSNLLVELERYSAQDETVRVLIDRKPRIIRARARVEEITVIGRAIPTTASPQRMIKRSKIIF